MISVCFRVCNALYCGLPSSLCLSPILCGGNAGRRAIVMRRVCSRSMLSRSCSARTPPLTNCRVVRSGSAPRVLSFRCRVHHCNRRTIATRADRSTRTSLGSLVVHASSIGLPFGLGFEASYLPPVTFAEATPSLASAALWFTRSLSDNLAVTVRAHATNGTVRGPITCPRSALQQQDPAAPCYGTSESHDEFRPNMFGGELIGAMSPGGSSSRLRLSAGLGVNALRPRFRVGFSDLLTGTDHTTVLVNVTRVTGLVAARVNLSTRCDVSAQGYASFGDAATVRGILGCTVFH